MNEQLLNEVAKLNSKLAAMDEKLDLLLGTTAFNDKMCPSELMRYLKISRRKYEQLLSQGLITMVETPDKVKYRKGHFMKSQIDLLIRNGII